MAEIFCQPIYPTGRMGSFEATTADSFIIYPNPTSDNVIIKSSMCLTVMYKIYSLTGKIITEGILQGEITIDVKNPSSPAGIYAKGIYFVQFNDMNGNLLECKKFIVQ